MRGAPWEGLFYGFVLEAIIAIGALMLALQSSDPLTVTLSWIVVVVLTLAAVRTIRRAARQTENPDRPVGRWWFGG